MWLSSKLLWNPVEVFKPPNAINVCSICEIFVMNTMKQTVRMFFLNIFIKNKNLLTTQKCLKNQQCKLERRLIYILRLKIEDIIIKILNKFVPNFTIAPDWNTIAVRIIRVLDAIFIIFLIQYLNGIYCSIKNEIMKVCNGMIKKSSLISDILLDWH